MGQAGIAFLQGLSGTISAGELTDGTAGVWEVTLPAINRGGGINEADREAG